MAKIALKIESDQINKSEKSKTTKKRKKRKTIYGMKRKKHIKILKFKKNTLEEIKKDEIKGEFNFQSNIFNDKNKQQNK